jgi:hypothetical protein
MSEPPHFRQAEQERARRWRALSLPLRERLAPQGRSQFSSSPGSKLSGTVDCALATGVGAEIVEGTFTPSRL